VQEVKVIQVGPYFVKLSENLMEREALEIIPVEPLRQVDCLGHDLPSLPLNSEGKGSGWRVGDRQPVQAVALDPLEYPFNSEHSAGKSKKNSG
jgi:hypothetical protein